MGLIRKLQNVLSRRALITIYKTFVRPHLDYADVMYDEAYTKSLTRHLNLFNIIPA